MNQAGSKNLVSADVSTGTAPSGSTPANHAGVALGVGPRYSYDEVPYHSNAYPQSQPEQLASQARLFGMAPKLPSQARVLELGCSAGGNLIPLAARYPQARFIGIELSRVEVDQARRAIEALNLDTDEVRHQSLTDLEPADEKFDYIICHGVYSWVPEAAQEAILDICRRDLAGEGVAYVSYNTYPGWKMREVIRDAILYHAGGIADPRQQVAQARAIIQYIFKITDPDTAFGRYLKSETELMSRVKDDYLYHDHMEVNNHPCYFKDFIQRAARHQLAYLGEAVLSDMAPQRLGPEVYKTLQRLSRDNILATEQYMDFFRNRTFRQTLLIHQHRFAQLRRNIAPEHLRAFFFSGRIRQEGDMPLNAMEEVEFGDHAGRKIKVREPFVKAALTVLGEHFPRAFTLEEWLRQARLKLTGREAGNDADIRLLDNVLSSLALNGMLHLHVEQQEYGRAGDARPRAFAPARYYAALQQAVVPSLRHEPVSINQFDMVLLPQLDGKTTTEAIKQNLLSRCLNREFNVARNNVQIVEEAELRPLLGEMITNALSIYEKLGLLQT